MISLHRLWPAALLSLLVAAGASAQPAGHVTAALVSETAAVRPGDPFRVAVRLLTDPGWHVYWKNPGDSGLPTTVQWTLPAGFTAGPLLWPAPSRFAISGEVTYGYEGEVLLMAEITPPRDLPEGARAAVSASVSWLACKIECVPGKAVLSLSLPVTSVTSGPASGDPRWQGSFARARALLPAADPLVRVTAAASQGALTLRVEGAAAAGDAYFFPESSGVVASSSPQPLAATTGGFSMRLARASPPSALPGRLDGVLVLSGGASTGPRVISVSAPLAGGGAPAAPAAAARPSLPLLLAVLFAFLGGLILNLMPCVLPVLSLKVMGFVREAHESPRRALVHGLVFTAGVVASFWILLGALLGLRAGGNLLGWGFQFQDPGVVTGMAVVVFLLGLNMFGVFEIGGRAAGVGAGLRGRRGLTGSFFTGILATLVATPCTAPFMGSALGFALTQPLVSAFLVFTSLAVGMAAPSLVLSASPRLLARVPKPGRWMESLKQGMGFLMMATVVWLGSVLAALAGAGALTFLLAALAAGALGAWVYGRWGGVDRRLPVRVTAAALGIILAAGGLVAAVAGSEQATRERLARDAGSAGAAAAAVDPEGSRGAVSWGAFTPGRLADLRAAGKPVFIDFGAEWCLTCTVNERVALSNPAVEKRLAALGVTTLRADWTDRNETIAAALAGYGRSGIPLYVLYGPGGAEPVLLPEIITPGIVLAALERGVAAAAKAAVPQGVAPVTGSPAAAPGAIEKAFSE